MRATNVAAHCAVAAARLDEQIGKLIDKVPLPVAAKLVIAGFVCIVSGVGLEDAGETPLHGVLAQPRPFVLSPYLLSSAHQAASFVESLSRCAIERSTVVDHCCTTAVIVRLRSSGGSVSKLRRYGVLLSPASSTRPPSDSSCASDGKLEPQRCISVSDSCMPLQDEISTSKAASTPAPYSTR
jgi:hypothetical protein